MPVWLAVCAAGGLLRLEANGRGRVRWLRSPTLAAEIGMKAVAGRFKAVI